MSDQSQAEVNQLVIVSGHRLLTLAVFEPETDDVVSAIYEHDLTELSVEPVLPLLDANAEITSVLPYGETGLAFGTLDGEVVFTGEDDDEEEEMDGVQASEAAVSALAEIDGVIVACTTEGEVLVLGDDVVSWKKEGPALFAIAHLDGATWIAGDEGYLARREGDGWKALDTGTKESLQSIAPVPGGLIAVGDGGAVVQVEGDRASLRAAGEDDLGGVAIWRGVAVVAAGDSGLLELGKDGTKVLREGPCERVAADDEYLVISADGELLMTTDGTTWKPLACAAPEPHEEHVHGADCNHN